MSTSFNTFKDTALVIAYLFGRFRSQLTTHVMNLRYVMGGAHDIKKLKHSLITHLS